MDKKTLRKAMLEQRKQMDPKEQAIWDEKILEQVKRLNLETQGTVYCYTAVRGETSTREIIRWYLNRGVRVAVPRVRGRDMDFYYINGEDDLIAGSFGIPEPDPARCLLADCETAPVLVPGVAFSRSFDRLGYGAGYYDRFFVREPHHPKIALCYSFQLVGDVAAESHDVKMDRVVTEEGIWER